MRIPRVAWVMLVAAGCGVLLWRESLGQPPPAPTAPGPVAILDVQEVLLNYQRANDLRSDLDRRQQVLQSEIKKRRERIDRIQAELGGLVEGSAEYINRSNEMRREAIDGRSYQEYEEMLLSAEHQRMLKALYEDISRMAAIVAKERGYKVVFSVDHKMPKTTTIEQLTTVLQDRKVLYGDPSVDITEAVLKRLNDAQRPAAATRP